VAAAFERGLLALTAGERVLRLTPPLTVDSGECEQALAILREACAS
jgi:4-aminobutyrate aminotransferase-like enzyme